MIYAASVMGSNPILALLSNYSGAILNNPEQLKEQALKIARAIDTQIENEDEEGYRTHLGASVIGNECARYLFYHFRWMHRETRSARMIRLHGKGFKFEVIIRARMKKLGAQFLDKMDETGKQVKFSAINQHFGGSCDGVFIWPEFGFFEPTLLECKTSGTGSPFNDLNNKEFKEVKEQHFIQDSTYGQTFGIKQMLYVCENKNDSEWAWLVIDLDWKRGEDAHKKAEFVIFSTQPPPRAFKKRNFFKCNMCSMQGICWDGTKTDINCRSCSSAIPALDGKWYCKHFQQYIPGEQAILKACPNHSPIQA